MADKQNNLIVHPTFKLKTPLTIMGLEIKDIALMAIAFAALRPLMSSMLGVRIGFLVAALFVWTFSRFWINVKDNIPEKFMPHVMAWLTEVDYYEVGIDDENYPLIIDANMIAELNNLKNLEVPN